MSQTTRVHHDRLDSAVLDWLAKDLRDRARRPLPLYGPTAQQIRDMVEFLVRPTAEAVRQLESLGATRASRDRLHEQHPAPPVASGQPGDP